MSNLVTSEETRQAISNYFTKTPELHLRKTKARYIVSANRKRHYSNGQEIYNNHEEANTLIFHTLSKWNLSIVLQLRMLLTLTYTFIVEILQDDIVSQPLHSTSALVCQYYSFNK